MASKDPKHQIKCPFWSMASKKCSIGRNGLFIPLDDHVEAFCKTTHFVACNQYTLYSENQICLLENVRKSVENRRKYMRIERSHDVTLVKNFKPRQLESQFSYEAQFSYKARTIDVSSGGMRMAINNPLLHDTTVHCSFDNSFPPGLHEVTVRVEWCNKQIDEPGYQAGLSFKEDDIVEAMGRYLDQQNQ